MSNLSVLNKFSLGDMVLAYLTDAGGHVSLSLLPAVCAEKADILSKESEGLVQLHLRGDSLPGGFINGMTLTETSSTHLMKLKAQTADTSDGCTVIKTLLSDGRGHEAAHVLSWKENAKAVETYTVFENCSDTPAVLEMLSSFSLSGLTPFGASAATDRMVLHRIRSWWSAEGKVESGTLSDYHLEPSWSLGGIRMEKFCAVGSMPVRQYFPFAAVEDTDAGVTWAAQIACPSSWQIEVRRNRTILSVSGGLADYETGHWSKTVLPGESFTSPSAYITVGKGGLDEVSQRLLDLHLKGPLEPDGTLPVIFNEFCTTWGSPTEENIANIVSALRGRQIDTMVIDTGWYGNGEWWNLIGDWTPSPDKFPSGIAHTADTIAESGMRPGIWFELENATASSQLAKHHPDWMLRRNGAAVCTAGRMFLDMQNPQVHEYLRESVISFLKENGFRYLKIDYNDSIGLGCDDPDGLGEGLRRNMLASQAFFREILNEVPDIQIEICASGGHRLEPSMLNTGTFASFSDAHECIHIPVIAANLHRVMQPSKSEIWAVLHETDSLRRINYSMANTLLGVMCLSGDVLNLSAEQWDIVDRCILLYKSASSIIRNGVSAFFGAGINSYAHPEGWQAVIRKEEKTGRTLAVLHTFAGELPEKVVIPVEAERIDAVLCSEGNEIQLTENGLEVGFRANFEAVAVLLSK